MILNITVAAGTRKEGNSRTRHTARWRCCQLVFPIPQWHQGETAPLKQKPHREKYTKPSIVASVSNISDWLYGKYVKDPIFSIPLFCISSPVGLISNRAKHNHHTGYRRRTRETIIVSSITNCSVIYMFLNHLFNTLTHKLSKQLICFLVLKPKADGAGPMHHFWGLLHDRSHPYT